ncbi:dihydrolipoamide dehydrogenase [Knoellia sp. S7-12]|uniref:dihydrolipoamide dehydrogenase n=1 Tax=Knoellia sp. S7-12 TaxID=3126698 RepID=UPI003367D248
MAASEIEAPKGRAPWLALGLVVLAVVSIAIAMGISFAKGDDPTNVAVYDANGDGMDALLTGIVEVTPSCVKVSVGDEAWTPVFPRGSTHMANDTLVWGGREFLSGDPIELGGGEVSPDGDLVIPAGCPRRHLWLVAPR